MCVCCAFFLCPQHASLAVSILRDDSKPALARGELQLLGATTLDEYRKYIEKVGKRLPAAQCYRGHALQSPVR